jgi:hypothetical protein
MHTGEVPDPWLLLSLFSTSKTSKRILGACRPSMRHPATPPDVLAHWKVVTWNFRQHAVTRLRTYNTFTHEPAALV